MKPKHTFFNLDGTVHYPECPQTIMSKEDLLRWFENTSQISGDSINDREHLLKHLPPKFIIQHTATEIQIMFPKCKYSARVYFYENECNTVRV